MKLKETYIDSWFNKIKDQVELEESLIMEAKQVGEIYYCCPNFYALLSILGYPSYNEQIIRKSKALEIIKPVEGNTQTIDTYSFEKDTNNEIIGRKYNLVSMWRLAYNNKELFLNYLDTELAKLEDYEKQNNIEELRNDCATYTELFRKFETMPRGGMSETKYLKNSLIFLVYPILDTVLHKILKADLHRHCSVTESDSIFRHVSNLLKGLHRNL